MSRHHPSSVCFTSDIIDDYSDDGSELTWQCDGDGVDVENDGDCNNNNDQQQQPAAAAAHTRYLYTESDGSKIFDATHPSVHQKDRIVVNIRTLVAMKVQIAKQKEQLDMVTSQLNMCQMENTKLKVKNEELDGLLFARDNMKKQSSLQPFPWFGQGPTHQSLQSNNAVDIIQKSVQGYFNKLAIEIAIADDNKQQQRGTRDGQTTSGGRRSDIETIDALRRENESLRRQLHYNRKSSSSPPPDAMIEKEKGCCCFCSSAGLRRLGSKETAKTSLETDSTTSRSSDTDDSQKEVSLVEPPPNAFRSRNQRPSRRQNSRSFSNYQKNEHIINASFNSFSDDHSQASFTSVTDYSQASFNSPVANSQASRNQKSVQVSTTQSQQHSRRSKYHHDDDNVRASFTSFSSVDIECD